MSYYNFNKLFPPGQATDRVRGAKMPAEGPELTHIEEAFTSENWIVRLYKVKPLDNFGRDHISATAFDSGKKKIGKKVGGVGMRQGGGKKGVRVLRV